jgi:hypothetical protein
MHNTYRVLVLYSLYYTTNNKPYRESAGFRPDLPELLILQYKYK